MKNLKTKSDPSRGLDARRIDFYPSILESIAEGIVVIGLNKKIIFVNKMAKELIGLRSEIPQGVSCNKIIKTDLCLNNCPLDSTRNRSSCTSHFLNINLYRDTENTDTSSIPLCLNVAPLNDEKGNMIGIIENFRPMSEAIKVIESLKKSNVVLTQEKDKVDSIIESLADGVFTVDRTLHITSFNKGMEILTGFKNKDSQTITIEPDRKKAIKLAIETAGKDDIVLIAGKGHETYQIIGKQKFHFSDKEIAKQCLKKLQRHSIA